MEAYKRGSHTVWDRKASVGARLLGYKQRQRYRWAEYIKNQTPTEPDDDFNVT
jgi:hypothetical protein